MKFKVQRIHGFPSYALQQKLLFMNVSVF